MNNRSKNVCLNVRWLWLIGLAILCSSASEAQDQFQVRFEQERYDVISGDKFLVNVLVDPVPMNGLYSFGVKLIIAATNGIVVDTAAVAAVRELDNNGVRVGGAVRQVLGRTAAVKGTLVFPEAPPATATNTLLASFTLTDLAPGIYDLRLEPFNTLGATEDLFVDGLGDVLDKRLRFGTGLVNHRPSVALIKPPDNSQFEPTARIPVEATAADPDGQATVVELAGNSGRLAELIGPPFAFTLTNVVAGSNRLTAVAIDSLGARSLPAEVMFTVLGPPLEILAPLHLNRQTGLYEQSVRVRNLQAIAAPAVRLTVRGLPLDVVLQNASGTVNGTPYVQHNQAVAPGSFVDFRLEYFVPDRRMITQPDLLAEVVMPDELPEPVGMIFSVTRSLRLADGAFLVEFPTVAGRHYTIQYSSDLQNWMTAVPSVAGNGSQVQWIDAGPPKTATNPAGEQNRYYRVLLLP